MAKLSFDAICQYSEDSIRQCRELAHYFKRRCQHELEFYKTATKNAPVASGSKGKGTVSGSLGTTPLQPANVAEHDSPTQGTSLWSFVDTMCSQYTKTAQLHRVWAIHLATTVLEPLQTDIRGFEVALKAHVERGAGYTKSLQDVYTSLKRAKAVYDGCQSAVIEAGSALQKARQNPNVREKDLEKISQKAVALQEKSQMAADALQVCQDICNVAQEDYYNSLMPSLIEEMRQKEEDRCYAIKRFLTLYNDLEKQFADARMTLHEMSGDQIQQIDIEEDLDVLRKETIAVVHEDRAQDAVSVASLLNPLKSGRMLVKSGEVLASWKNRYFCFMHMERRLYIFDGEDALCPRDVISITNASIHALHPSYFGKPHAFQIIYDSPDKSTRHVANLAAESATETDCWMEHLRKYTYCCATCAASFGYRQETQFNSHLVAGESGFRPVRSFQLMIGEIKDLPTFNVAGLRNRLATSPST
ncbi:hypothetical protein CAUPRSCDRAFT_11863 [Caulochytrium protostelioides]|uniref:PH domain-containing protein n=1 Tax=Caulochytrium protostelioides TaxID=1555241 RepID=A0A4V1ITB2_9FUNG|nr:hypothetical protein CAUPRSCDRAFT_11863 [Caulochytrium protostelioides]